VTLESIVINLPDEKFLSRFTDFFENFSISLNPNRALLTPTIETKNTIKLK